MHDMLKKIIHDRQNTIAHTGANYGETIPLERTTPIVAFPKKAPFCIAEIKHGSPSQGRFNPLDVTDTVTEYVFNGTSCISVVTEPNHFFGTLNDITCIKTLFPMIPILRKDFLTEVEDIDISYRIGADAVLLITILFIHRTDGLEHMKLLFEKIKSYGMTPVVEVHSIEEIAFIKTLHAPVIGINARNLDTMKIDRVQALSLLPYIPPATTIIFESGIQNYDDAFTATASGFSGILVGTSLLCSDTISSQLRAIMQGLHNGSYHATRFYPCIATHFLTAQKPLLKICGITNADDAKAALACGADCLGLICTESPRKITESVARGIRDAMGSNALLIGVIRREDYLLGEQLVMNGVVDALQIHGLSHNNDHSFIRVPWYEAVEYGKESAAPDMFFRLHDTHTADRSGHAPLSKETVACIATRERFPCIAGGITPENIAPIVHTAPISMIDVCSGVESSPGKKSYDHMKQLIETIHTTHSQRKDSAYETV